MFVSHGCYAHKSRLLELAGLAGCPFSILRGESTNVLYSFSRAENTTQLQCLALLGLTIEIMITENGESKGFG